MNKSIPPSEFFNHCKIGAYIGLVADIKKSLNSTGIVGNKRESIPLNQQT